eukprot:364343-Chlamydomonas_euryale.AAC.9
MCVLYIPVPVVSLVGVHTFGHNLVPALASERNVCGSRCHCRLSASLCEGGRGDTTSSIQRKCPSSCHLKRQLQGSLKFELSSSLKCQYPHPGRVSAPWLDNWARTVLEWLAGCCKQLHGPIRLPILDLKWRRTSSHFADAEEEGEFAFEGQPFGGIGGQHPLHTPKTRRKRPCIWSIWKPHEDYTEQARVGRGGTGGSGAKCRRGGIGGAGRAGGAGQAGGAAGHMLVPTPLPPRGWKCETYSIPNSTLFPGAPERPRGTVPAEGL